jgi:hypothetical protein
MRNFSCRVDRDLPNPPPSPESRVRVNFRKCWLIALIFCWLGLTAASPAQVLDAPASGVGSSENLPPPDGIADRAGMFQRNPALFGKIANRLRQIREDHGYAVYLVVESVLVKDDPHLLATELRQAWIPDGNGIVLVFEMDSRRLSLGQQFEQTIAADGQIRGGIPSFEMNAIILKASQGMNTKTSPEEFVDFFLTGVTDGLNDYFRRKNSSVPDSRSVRLAMVIIGGASVLALIGLGAAWLLKRSDRKGGGCFFFPEIETSERLGAPYGGGAVSSRRFGTDGAGR